MTIKKHFEIPVENDQQLAVDVLDQAFQADGLSLSRQGIKQIMQKGCVWLETDSYTQRLRRAKKALKQGNTLHCYYDEDVLRSIPPVATLISDEGEYSLWNKPSGMLSQGSKWGDHCTIYRWAEKHLTPERAGFIVHRLDRAASGLIIIAHKKKIAAQFSTMFKNKEIEKHYSVKVKGNFSQFSHFNATVTTIDEMLDGKNAVSHIFFIRYDESTDVSLLDVVIETGRKHQIRKHLSGAGYEVIGDRLYGSTVNPQIDLQLMAVSLQFKCPVGKVERNYSI